VYAKKQSQKKRASLKEAIDLIINQSQIRFLGKDMKKRRYIKKKKKLDKSLLKIYLKRKILLLKLNSRSKIIKTK